MEIGGGIRVRVLDLETLIAIKEELGGEKDRAVLPVHCQTRSRRPREWVNPAVAAGRLRGREG